MLGAVTPNGSALRDFRQLRGYTLRRFAHLIGKDPGYWSRVERNQQGASDDTLHTAATVLEISIDSITRETPGDQEEPGEHPH